MTDLQSLCGLWEFTKIQEVTNLSCLPLAQVIVTVTVMAGRIIYLLQFSAHILKSLLTFFQVNNLGGTLWQPKCHSVTSVNDLESPVDIRLGYLVALNCQEIIC